MIKLLVLDVDGCMTNGDIIYTHDGVESKHFNVKDGFGIVSWIKLGNEVAIITGRESTIVKNRAHELGIQHLFQGIKNKDVVLNELLNSLKIHHDEVAAIGDDINDYKMLKNVGRSFTPKDAVVEIQELVDTVLSKKGGEGAVREMIDTLLVENGQKEAFLALWI